MDARKALEILEHQAQGAYDIVPHLQEPLGVIADALDELDNLRCARPIAAAEYLQTLFVLHWDEHGCAALRRRDGYTVVAFMGERTYKRILKAMELGADFNAIRDMFPKKRTAYQA